MIQCKLNLELYFFLFLNLIHFIVLTLIPLLCITLVASRKNISCKGVHLDQRHITLAHKLVDNAGGNLGLKRSGIQSLFIDLCKLILLSY